MRLEFRDLTLDYDGVRALDRITIALEGDIVGFLGANGSGKTSVLRIVAGVTPASSGEALVDGTPVVAGLVPWISYLPQETGFFPFHQHPQQTLRLSLAFRGLVDPEAPRQVLAALGLGEEDRSAEGFSGGMKQKLRVAQALIHSPRLLLLDEPTTGLDPRERNRILRLLERLRGRVGVVFSTHDPADAAAVSDQVVILDRGSVAAAGSPADLTRLARERVFEVRAASSFLPDSNPYEIIRAERTAAGFRLRVIGARPAGAEAVEPTLEDAYLLLTQRTRDGRRLES